MATETQIEAWQRDYDAGMTAAQIADRAGVHRTTVNGAITTTRRTGRRPTLDPIEVVRAMQRNRTINRTAEAMGATPGRVRNALWHAGLINHPSRRGVAGLDWDTPRTPHGSAWDIDERIRVRNSRIRELRRQGLTPAEISTRTGIDVDIIRRVRK